MSIILKHCCFLHIPKTGGVWATEAIRNANLVVTLKRRRHDLLPFTRLPIIASVRNPVDWYVSRWSSPEHVRRLRRNKPYDGLLKAAGNLGHDFNDWLDALLETHGFVTQLYQKFLGNNFQRAAHICKNETLTEDLICALKCFGEKFNEDDIRNTPPTNNSNKVAKSKAIPRPDQIRRIFKSEKLIFNRFNYSTELKDYLK